MIFKFLLTNLTYLYNKFKVCTSNIIIKTTDTSIMGKWKYSCLLWDEFDLITLTSSNFFAPVSCTFAIWHNFFQPFVQVKLSVIRVHTNDGKRLLFDILITTKFKRGVRDKGVSDYCRCQFLVYLTIKLFTQKLAFHPFLSILTSTINLLVTSKKGNHQFTNSRI